MIQDWTDLPGTVPVFPLTGALLLPRGALPLNIFEPRYRAMVEDAIKGKRVIGMVQPRAHEAGTREPPVYDIGCAGRLTAFQELEDGRYIITLTGIRRFRIVEEMARTTPYRLFRVDYAEFMQDFEPQEATSADREYFLKLIRQYVDIQGFAVDWDVIENTDTETLIHASSTLAPWAPNEKQLLLEAPDVDSRYQTLIALYEMAIAQARGAGGSLQ
jgi:Lon protease-like protein